MEGVKLCLSFTENPTPLSYAKAVKICYSKIKFWGWLGILHERLFKNIFKHTEIIILQRRKSLKIILQLAYSALHMNDLLKCQPAD